MSEFTKEYKIAQFLAQKMTGELSLEEEQELAKLKKESGSAIVDEQVLNPANKRERDELISHLDTSSSWQKVVKRIHSKKPKKSCMVGKCRGSRNYYRVHYPYSAGADSCRGREFTRGRGSSR